MLRLLFTFLALALGSATVSCVSKTCTAMGCSYTVNVFVGDEQGDPVQRFSGTAMIEGTTYTFECTEEPSGSSVAGGTSDGFAMCSSGSITLPFPAGSQPSIEFMMSSEEGLIFEGEINPSYVENNNFNGKGCGQCTFAEAAVTLQ